MGDTSLREQHILNRIFNVEEINVLVVSSSSSYGEKDTELEIQKILNRCYENNQLRVIIV